MDTLIWRGSKDYYTMFGLVKDPKTQNKDQRKIVKSVHLSKEKNTKICIEEIFYSSKNILSDW